MKIIVRNDFCQYMVVIEFSDTHVAVNRTDYFYSKTLDKIIKECISYKDKIITYTEYINVVQGINIPEQIDPKKWNELINKENI